MCRDFAVLAGLYFVYPNAEAYGLPGLFLWWNLAGACFVMKGGKTAPRLVRSHMCV